MKFWTVVAILALSSLLPVFAREPSKVPDLTMRNVAPPAPHQWGPASLENQTKVLDLTMRNVAPPAPHQWGPASLENKTKVPDLTMRNVAPPAPQQWGPASLENQGNDTDMTGVKCQKAGGHCVDENDSQKCMVPLEEEPDCPKGEQCCKTGVTNLQLRKKNCDQDSKCTDVGGQCISRKEKCETKTISSLCSQKGCTCCLGSLTDQITHLEVMILEMDTSLDTKLTDIYEEVQRTGCCVDENEQCSYWASIRECEANPDYMHLYCRKSCHLCLCDGCFDENVDCCYWASIGECEANPNYMNLYCRLSCHLCGGCVDENEDCSYWASIGECKANPAYMNLFCRKSCHICGCVDYNENCSYWASIGECDANPGYMHASCRKSCLLCD